MSVIPRTAVAILGVDSPIMGDPEEATAASAYLRSTGQSTWRFRQTARIAESDLAELRSSTVSRAQGRLTMHLIPGAQELERSSGIAQSSFEQYAAVVTDIHSRARQLRAQVSDWLETIRRSAGVVDAILADCGLTQIFTWDSDVPRMLPLLLDGSSFRPSAQHDEASARTAELLRLHGDAWALAVRDWAGAQQQIRSAVIVWRNLIDERRQAEQQLIAALRETAIGRLLQMSITGGFTAEKMIAYSISGEFRGRLFVDPGELDERVVALFNEGLPPEQLAKAWLQLGLSADEISQLPIETLAMVATRDELPAWVQDVAAVKLMHLAMLDTETTYRAMGFGGPESISIAEFREQVRGMYSAWIYAHESVTELRMSNQPVQLLGFGSHDGILTAAISLGDLDTATHVDINVSGMYSSAGDMINDTQAAASLRRQAVSQNHSQSFAVVAWIGYRSPNAVEVLNMSRAEAGAQELASFIDGNYFSRAAAGFPMEVSVVSAHSFGSTTAAEALQLIDPRARVDVLVTYGSAGFEFGTQREKLRADQVYVLESSQDWVAGPGRLLSWRFDPQHLPTAVKLSIDGDEEFAGVTGHSMYKTPKVGGNEFGYFSPGTRSLDHISKILVDGVVR